MPYNIQLPDGTIIEGIPDNVSKEEARQRIIMAFPQLATPESGFIPAVKAGTSGLKEAGYALLGRTGLMDEEEAQKAIEREQRYQQVTFKPTEEGWTEAPLTKIAELGGQSLPYMAAPIAAGVGAAMLPVTGTAALLTGVGAVGAVSGAQFTGTNLLRQMETGKSIGETDLGNAALAAVPQAALDVVGLRMIPFIRGVFGKAGRDLTEEQARLIASKSIKDVAADYTLATGKAMTVEGLTEAAQQSLERLQAGLSITDEEARQEYLDSFIGGAVLGGVLAPPGRYMERRSILSQTQQPAPVAQPGAQPAGPTAPIQPGGLQGPAGPTASAIPPEEELTPEQELALQARIAAVPMEQVAQPAALAPPPAQVQPPVQEITEQPEEVEPEAPPAKPIPEAAVPQLELLNRELARIDAKRTDPMLSLDDPIFQELDAREAQIRSQIQALTEPPASVKQVEGVVGFKTAKGSTYELDQVGRSSRTKVSPGKGQGTTYPPHTVFYVTPENSRSILEDKIGGEASIRLGFQDGDMFRKIGDISELPEGATPLVAVVDRETNQIRGYYPAQTQPAVGLAPVEKLYNNDGTANTHVGNPIVELFTAKPKAPPVEEIVELPSEEDIEGALVEDIPARSADEVQKELNRARQNLNRLRTATKQKKIPDSDLSSYEARVQDLEAELAAAKPKKKAPAKVEKVEEVETEESFGFGQPVPEYIPEELEQKVAELERARAAEPNLFRVLRGKLTPSEVNDISPDKSMSLLSAGKGKGKDLSDIINDGVLDEFLPYTLRTDADTFDLQEATEFIKDQLRQDQRTFPEARMTYEFRELTLPMLRKEIADIEAEMEPADANRILQEVYAEERAAIEAYEKRAPEAEERGPRVSEDAFDLQGQTPEELAELERREKTGQAAREREEAERKRAADLEREVFALQPSPGAPPPAQVSGDLFGAQGMAEQPARRPDEGLARAVEKAAVGPSLFEEEEAGSDIAEIKKNMIRYASGMSAISDLREGAYARSKYKNFGIGVDVSLLSEPAMDALAEAVRNLKTPVFVDSGAFGAFRKQLKGESTKPLNFDEVLKKYDSILTKISDLNEVEDVDYPRPKFVMPDVIGDQQTSINLIRNNKKWIATELDFNLSDPIVPIQGGEKSLSQVFDELTKILGGRKFIVGIPSQEAAISREELAAFLEKSKPERVHFLGAASDKRLNPLLALVAKHSPKTRVSADASQIRSKILNAVQGGKSRKEAIQDSLREETDGYEVLEAYMSARQEEVKEKAPKPKYEIQRKESYRGRTTPDVTYQVLRDGKLLREYNRKKDAVQYLDILTLSKEEVEKKYPELIIGARETIVPSQDKYVGVNASGEKLYERRNGERYRMRMDRADRPNGYPDFGGDLAPATPIEEEAAGAEDEPQELLRIYVDTLREDADATGDRRYEDASNELFETITTKREMIIPRKEFDALVSIANASPLTKGNKYGIVVEDTQDMASILTFTARGLTPTQKRVEVSFQLQETTRAIPDQTLEEYTKRALERNGVADFQAASKRLQEETGVSKPVADARIKAEIAVVKASAGVEFGTVAEEEWRKAIRERSKLDDKVKELSSKQEKKAKPPETGGPTPGELKNIQYWQENVAPAIRDYLEAYKKVGAERLERSNIKPAGISPKQWLIQLRDQESKFEKGRKVSDTGIQMLSKKDLWPTKTGDGEVLRKAMLKAIQQLKKAPGYSSNWIDNMERGSYDGVSGYAPVADKTVFGIASDGIDGYEVDPSQVPNGSDAFQYVVGRVEKGDKEEVYRRRADERGTFGGWRVETSVDKLLPEEPAAAKEPSADISSKMLEGTEKETASVRSVAEQFAGVPVYYDRVKNIGLVRGYNALTGAPVYIPVIGDRYVGRDVESTNVGEVLPYKAELIAVKNRLEKQAEQAHKDDPFIKFENGVAMSENMDPKIAGIVREWKKMLNLDGVNVYFSTIEDAKENRTKFTGPQRVIGSGTLDANELGSMRRMADGSYYVLFKKTSSTSATLERIAHEMGHIHEREAYENASPELKKKLQDAHARWLQQRKGKTAREAVNMLRAKSTAQITTIASGKKMAADLSPYWSSFSEWYADQVSRWAVTDEKPVSVVEKFFAKLGRALRKFYNTLRGRNFLPDETFVQYLNEVKPKIVDSKIGVGPGAPQGELAFKMTRDTKDDEELVRRYRRANTPMLEHAPTKRALINSAAFSKNMFKEMVNSPTTSLSMMFNALNRGIMYLRNKNVWFGSGINEADRIRYSGQVRTAENLATASLALDNMIRGGNIASQVVFLGGIKFNPKSLTYGAVETDTSMVNVYKAEAEIKKRLGEQLGTNIIQGYLEAKRSKSIKDELADRQQQIIELNEQIDAMVKLARATEANPAATAEQRKQIDRALRILFREFDEAQKDLQVIQEVAEDKVTMSDKEISDFIAREKVHPELRTIIENFNGVNQGLLRFWREVGLLSEARYKRLAAIKDYVPWQRIMNDEADVHSPLQATTKSATNIGKERLFKSGRPSVINDFVVEAGQDVFRIQPSRVNRVKLNGSRLDPKDYTVSQDGEIRIKVPYKPGDVVVIETQREIENMIDNMTRNVMRMTMNGLRQYAANRIVSEYATRDSDNKIMTFPKVDKEKGRFDYIADGRRVVVEIQDPLIAEGALGMEAVGMKMWEPLAAAANLTRRTITSSPIFQLKQVFKDAPTAALVTGVKNPHMLIGGVYSSFISAVRKSDPAGEILRRQGIGGFYSPARTPEAEVKREIGIINKNALDYAMKALDHWGDSSDMAQRIAVYNRVMKESNGDEALALYQAANVINFLRHGSGQVSQALFKTVPFLNAYAQSIDVLYDALRGGGLRGKDRKAALQALAWTGSMLAGMTILYTFLVGDDEDYLKLDDQSKVRNIVLPGTQVVLPMNTSAAFFFKAIPELITNKVINEGTDNEVDAKRLRTALKESAIDMLLGPNPTPSAVKPFIEIGLNRNFFTSRDITPKSLQDLDAYEQYDIRTSEAAKLLSGLTGTKETRLLNPMEADHLVRSIFGTAGAMVAWASNFIGESAEYRPEMGLKEMPITGAFMRPDVPRGREDLLYKLKESTDKKYNTFERLAESGRLDEAEKYLEKYPNLIAYRDYTSEMASELKEINAAIRFIGMTRDKSYTPEQKRKDILDLLNAKQDILEGVEQFRKEAYSD